VLSEAGSALKALSVVRKVTWLTLFTCSSVVAECTVLVNILTAVFADSVLVKEALDAPLAAESKYS